MNDMGNIFKTPQTYLFVMLSCWALYTQTSFSERYDRYEDIEDSKQDNQPYVGPHDSPDNGDYLMLPVHIKLHGDLHNLAYYYTYIEVGTPRQRQSVVIDTGSPNLMLTDARCNHCGYHDNPSFDSVKSKTSSLIEGTSLQCANLGGIPESDDHGTDVCRFEQEYAEGSKIKGVYVTDYIEFEDDFGSNITHRTQQIGCITLETKLIYFQRADGVLGLGPAQIQNGNKKIGACLYDKCIVKSARSSYHKEDKHKETKPRTKHGLSITREGCSGANNSNDGEITGQYQNPISGSANFITDFVNKHFPSKNHQFTLHLKESGGWLTLGGHNDTSYRDKNGNQPRSDLLGSVMWIPMDINEYYSISVGAVEFVGYIVRPCSNRFLIDSGSTNTSLEAPVYNVIYTFYKSLCDGMQSIDSTQRSTIYTKGKRITSKQTRNLKDDESQKQNGALNTPKNISNRYDGETRCSSVESSTDGTDYNEVLDLRLESNPPERTTYLIDVSKHLLQQQKIQGRCSVQSRGECFCFSDISEMPSIHLIVKGGKKIQWNPQSYFIRRPSKHRLHKHWWCLGIDKATDANVLGATFLKNNYVAFDLNGRFGRSRTRHGSHSATSRSSPLPRAPISLQPNVKTLPVRVTTAVCREPQATELSEPRIPSTTGVGSEHSNKESISFLLPNLCLSHILLGSWSTSDDPTTKMQVGCNWLVLNFMRTRFSPEWSVSPVAKSVTPCTPVLVSSGVKVLPAFMLGSSDAAAESAAAGSLGHTIGRGFSMAAGLVVTGRTTPALLSVAVQRAATCRSGPGVWTSFMVAGGLAGAAGVTDAISDGAVFCSVAEVPTLPGEAGVLFTAIEEYINLRAPAPPVKEINSFKCTEMTHPVYMIE
ncbi:aspartic protease PM5, putative [Babesia ovis]|uniref:Aspartic protease PM5, putative n=1 Tax=Babesia ovis TaxID=5869 RepID=A0A9W5TAA9_BABOV|nr:aspartic protease PM5, putative [Babesia ovis]